jgi:hypothetical protein
MGWDRHAAVGAGRGDRLTQDKVKKKSEQVREKSCNQNPEHGPHIASPGVSKDEAETQDPNSGQNAEYQGGAAIREHGPCSVPLGSDRTDNQSGQQCAAHKDHSKKSN